MSSLISNYSISVWEDILKDGKFIEQRICVIGADDMSYQGKVINPQFVRKANGEKKLTFQMYSQFIDNITGCKVHNRFSDLLKNETKIKLYYEDKWHDFIIKNIVENSSTFLNSYELTDAIVQELSKNGFDIVFDKEVNNNLGTIQKLATETILNTDWEVVSDTFTEFVEENLVYLLTNKTIKVNHIYTNESDEIVEVLEEELPINTKILGFYSSCKNKPPRFQFIYLDSDAYEDYSKDKVKVDVNRIIQEKDCQYYIDYPTANDYKETPDGFIIPKDFSVIHFSVGTLETKTDTTVSNWYRGKRFGFAQQTEYVPLLKTYCNLYHKSDDNGEIEKENNEPVLYYGYLNTEFSSPIFIENIITNSEFKGNTGWTGAYTGHTPNAKQVYAAKAESLYGRFYRNTFQRAETALENGDFDTTSFDPYLQITLPEKGLKDRNNLPFVINSGFYENRLKISNVMPGELWCLDVEIYSADGTQWDSTKISNNLNFDLQEVDFSSVTGGHSLLEKWGELKPTDGRLFIEIPQNKTLLTAEEFQKRKIKLVISPTDTNKNEMVFFIKKIALYKKVENEEGVIIEPGDLQTEGIVNNIHSFVAVSQVQTAKDIKELSQVHIKEKELDYSKYIPLYNEGAQKVRSITTKESNYFNILQSIAETFEAWLEISIVRDKLEPGLITQKQIAFRKSLGSENPASFRYGVNLKDIQRTFESKKIATKLIVKQNSNELGKNGFCTIARAGSNPTGESSIYDFRYFDKLGSLPSESYIAQMYYDTNPFTEEEAKGKDISETDTETNIQNYFNRLKYINDNIQTTGNTLNLTKQELVRLEADKVVQEGLLEAANESLGEVKEDFFALTGLYPDELGTNPFVEVRIKEQNDKWGDSKSLNPGWPQNWREAAHSSITPIQFGGINSLNWGFQLSLPETFSENETIPTKVAKEGKITENLILTDGGVATVENDIIKLECNGEIAGLGVAPTRNYEAGHQYKMTFTLQKVEGQLLNFGCHSDSFVNQKISIDGGKSFVDGNIITIPKTSSQTDFNIIIIGTFYKNSNDIWPYWVIQPNRGMATNVKVSISKLQISQNELATYSTEKTYYIQPTFELVRAGDIIEEKSEKIPCKIAAFSLKGYGTKTLGLVDSSGSTISRLLTSYVEFQKQSQEAKNKLEGENGLRAVINNKKESVSALEQTIQKLTEWKKALNKAFYTVYSRFIQEGTWMSEEYIDDDKYYNDALSVLYNSCEPQVAYTLNVLSVRQLPGYEHFTFNLGDKTYAEDPEFFGEGGRVEVTITEQSDFLDDPSKSSVKVQNFKNQFQDLFQKITATVQQVQYSTGSYEKAAALAEADEAIKGKFVTDGLAGLSGKLAIAGQTTVVQDQNGITLTDSATKDEMRLIGGAILMSIQDPESGERKWKTGLTPEGISASMVTAGTLNAGQIMIMNVDEPVFRWDAFGLSAFDVDWTNGVGNKTNPYRFVRYDKYGIYGIDQTEDIVVDGRSWKPSSIDEINNLATFALTWEGLKIKTDNVETLIGHNKKKIIDIVKFNENGTKDNILTLTEDGDLEISGVITAKAGGTIGGWKIGENCLFTEKSPLGTDNSFHLYSKGFSPEFSFGNSGNKTDWRLGIGANFGVDSQGKLFANGADISGTIIAKEGSLVDLTLEGNLEFSEAGSIIYDATNCRWNEYGILIGMGQIACWAPYGAKSDLNSGSLKAAANLTMVSPADNYCHVFLDKECLIAKITSSTNSDLSGRAYREYKIRWIDLIPYLASVAKSYYPTVEDPQNNYKNWGVIYENNGVVQINK